MPSMSKKTKYRSIFISDIHLGSRGSKAAALNKFLKGHTSEYLYLVGDIVDFWALRRKVFFPQSHVNVVRRILKRANSSKVFYIVGNHDEQLRQFLPMAFGDIQFVNEMTHQTADGRRFLVIHGDQYDQVMLYAKWLAFLGDIGYSLLMRANGAVNRFRRWFGMGYWSLSAYAKRKVKVAVNFIGQFEDAVAHDVRQRGLDGVICGHIHHAEIKPLTDTFAYMNCGDWVESCSVLVEHFDGRIELLRFPIADFVDERADHAEDEAGFAPFAPSSTDDLLIPLTPFMSRP